MTAHGWHQLRWLHWQPQLNWLQGQLLQALG